MWIKITHRRVLFWLLTLLWVSTNLFLLALSSATIDHSYKLLLVAIANLVAIALTYQAIQLYQPAPAARKERAKRLLSRLNEEDRATLFEHFTESDPIFEDLPLDLDQKRKNQA